MARIHELIRQVASGQPELAEQLKREYDILSERLPFGLNFERHTPEAVELPGRKVRTGDKVHVLPPRGEAAKEENKILWTVFSINKTPQLSSAKLIRSVASDVEETIEVPINDLVVVAEFQDPIFPGLLSTGKVQNGGHKPYHAVINGENYHALQALLFTHSGKVDAIYIDPPYNSGAKDWKYNNDYVELDDHYRHSKWLAFMERRLKLAKDLLNPDNSVLIVAIDEKEYLRLGLLLEQVFPDASMQMISNVINPGGSVRPGAFSRTDEYLFVLRFGNSEVLPLPLSSEWRGGKSTNTAPVAWRSLIRGGDSGRRIDRPNLFYPIYVYEDGRGIASIGEAINLETNKESISAPIGQTAVWPINSDGTEGRWRVSVNTSRANLEDGFIRANYKSQSISISYLAEGFAAAVRSNEIETKGRDSNGVVILGELGIARITPGTAWNLTSHNARDHGSALVSKFVDGRKFPYPKSLYAVEDILRFFINLNKNSIVVDFFAGSGTTAHAVMRLNREDNGNRQSISVTNNEVSADEQRDLIRSNLRPGEDAWEQFGICEYITKPRIAAAITGIDAAGKPLVGNYKFNGEFQFSDGLNENVEFFTLTYESRLQIEANRSFKRIAPLIWLRAGSIGRQILEIPNGWDITETYGVLEDLNKSDEFLEAFKASDTVKFAFIITDEDRLFEAVVRDLPAGVEPIRLFDAYIRNFTQDALKGNR